MLIKNSKAYKTVFKLKQVAQHHYGSDSNLSVLKFLYYSLMAINRFAVYEIDLSQKIPKPMLGSDFLVLKPTMQELNLYRAGLSLPREFYYDEMHGVEIAYIVLCKNELAYIHWVYLKGHPNRFLILDKDSAELNYNATLPKFRGRGLMNQIMRFINMDLKNQGFKKSYGVVNVDNYPAIKSMERAGFKVRRYITAIGPFNHKIQV